MEITCWNSEKVRIAFIIDAFDREIIAHVAMAGAGISGSDIRDMMLAAVESRFGSDRAPHQADAPDTLVYCGAKVVVGKDAKICTVRTCLTNTKAAISTERCSKPDPGHPELSRGREPWTDPTEHPDGPWR